jgi:hypothetical protein
MGHEYQIIFSGLQQLQIMNAMIKKTKIRWRERFLDIYFYSSSILYYITYWALHVSFG